MFNFPQKSTGSAQASKTCIATQNHATAFTTLALGAVLALPCGLVSMDAANAAPTPPVAYGISTEGKGKDTIFLSFQFREGKKQNLDELKVLKEKKIKGLQKGETILGIDIRPSTGQLFGLGSTSRLYTIDTQTGQATAVGGVFSTPLVGTHFGFDFNPTVDRIRIVSDADQNLRANPADGAVIVDGSLAYDTDTDGAGADAGDINAGENPFVVGAGYTNSDTDPGTATTLYVIDSQQDTLVIQAPPNAGTLNTVGELGVDVSVPLGFDILTQNATNIAYASVLTTQSKRSLVYEIDLTDGSAEAVAEVRSSRPLTAFAIVGVLQ